LFSLVCVPKGCLTELDKIQLLEQLNQRRRRLIAAFAPELDQTFVQQARQIVSEVTRCWKENKFNMTSQLTEVNQLRAEVSLLQREEGGVLSSSCWNFQLSSCSKYFIGRIIEQQQLEHVFMTNQQQQQ
jgi:hypothetical protein